MLPPTLPQTHTHKNTHAHRHTSDSLTVCLEPAWVSLYTMSSSDKTAEVVSCNYKLVTHRCTAVIIRIIHACRTRHCPARRTETWVDLSARVALGHRLPRARAYLPVKECRQHHHFPCSRSTPASCKSSRFTDSDSFLSSLPLLSSPSLSSPLCHHSTLV